MCVRACVCKQAQEQIFVIQFNEVSIVDGLCSVVFVAVINECQLQLMMYAKNMCYLFRSARV